MKPIHPMFVLILSLAAPGLGHIAIGRGSRGLGIAAFALLFAALTWKIAPADRSLTGRAAAGCFVWALSIPDAYKSACRRRVASRG